MKQRNQKIKNLDNLLVSTKIAGDKLWKRVGEVGQVKEIKRARISAMKAKQAKSHGTFFILGGVKLRA